MLSSNCSKIRVIKKNDTVRCWCLCTDYYWIVYNYHTPVRIFLLYSSGGTMSLIHPPFGAKGKDKTWNTELRGRFYGQFSNKFGDQLLVEVSQISLLWTGPRWPSGYPIRSQACNSAFIILEHTQTASPLSIPTVHEYYSLEKKELYYAS